MVATYLEFLEMGYFEVKEAFQGLADEYVWRRPAEGLLSVGELAGHIAYWEAVRLASEGGEYLKTDLSRCSVSSPLVDHRFAYYPTTIATPPSEEHLAMTAQQVLSELLRVHEEAGARFQVQKPDLESVAPGWPPNFTYGEYLRYAGFHIAYHTGQMYSVRHLLGEQTPDN